MAAVLIDIVWAVEGAGAILGGTVALISFRKRYREDKRQRQRIEDALLGTEATHGIPATPSVFQQLTELRAAVADIQQTTRELRPNGGGSLADKITRIDRRLTSHIEHAEKVEKELYGRLPS